jgi:hypothetical protein
MIRPMIIISRSPKIALAALAVSLAIFGVLYFTVIKPSSDTANATLRNATQQTNQAVKAVDKQTGGAVPGSVQKLTACIAAAGADTGKIQSCQTKFGG